MSSGMDRENVALAVSGASGSVIAQRFAAAVLERGLHLHFVCTRYGRLTWEHELEESLDNALAELGRSVR